MEKTRHKNRYVKKRHRVFYFILSPVISIINRMYGFKRTKCEYDRSRNYLIYSNHQAPVDPVHIDSCLRDNLYYVAGHQIFHKGLVSKLLVWIASPISIRKGAGDPSTIMEMFRVAKEGGNICIFIEGNRTWVNGSVYVPPSAAKLAQKMGRPLMLFNLQGGFGVGPRFGNKRRKGPFTGKIARILEPEEMKAMPLEELRQIIQDSLDVRDGGEEFHYRSKKKAEYLERLFFVCPSCHSHDTLFSERNIIRCTSCGCEAEYKEDLTLEFHNPSLPIRSLREWYNIQAEDVLKMENFDGVITKDEKCVLYDSSVFPKKKLTKGNAILTKDSFTVGGHIFPIEEIDSASCVAGTILQIIHDNKTYLVYGHRRFSPVKYCQLFQRLVPGYRNRGDKYYDLDIRFDN